MATPMTERNQTRIYPLDGRGLTEEQMAVVFAMTSRSPDPFDQIASRVSEEKAAGFHEKWVLDYGHASVAEHAVLHMAIEGISRVACDELENNRLASYTEKSSRYQVIEQGSYHVPAELDSLPELRRRYVKTMDFLFEAYRRLLAACIARLKEENPQGDGEKNAAYNLRMRRIATDACRGTLPAATLTNAGMTANARSMEYAISKLLSSGLAETKKLGRMLKEQGQSAVPTLIKYAGWNPYLAARYAHHGNPPGDPPETGPDGNSVPGAVMVRCDRDALRNLAATLLYRDGAGGYEHAWNRVQTGGGEEQRRIVREALEGLGPHDQPPREFETVHYTFEFTMDYGALREFRRHRMMTPTFQPLTVRHGTNVPRVIRDNGLTEEFQEAASAAEEIYGSLERETPAIAQYAVTHAHNQKALATVNLRECYHLFRLRTSERAHESIRGPVQEALRLAADAHPELLAAITG